MSQIDELPQTSQTMWPCPPPGVPGATPTSGATPPPPPPPVPTYDLPEFPAVAGGPERKPRRRVAMAAVAAIGAVVLVAAIALPHLTGNRPRACSPADSLGCPSQAPIGQSSRSGDTGHPTGGSGTPSLSGSPVSTPAFGPSTVPSPPTTMAPAGTVISDDSMSVTAPSGWSQSGNDPSWLCAVTGSPTVSIDDCWNASTNATDPTTVVSETAVAPLIPMGERFWTCQSPYVVSQSGGTETASERICFTDTRSGSAVPSQLWITVAQVATAQGDVTVGNEIWIQQSLIGSARVGSQLTAMASSLRIYSVPSSSGGSESGGSGQIECVPICTYPGTYNPPSDSIQPPQDDTSDDNGTDGSVDNGSDGSIDNGSDGTVDNSGSDSSDSADNSGDYSGDNSGDYSGGDSTTPAPAAEDPAPPSDPSGD